MQGIVKITDNMKRKLKKYKQGGAATSMTRYKKYQNAGVYGQSALNLPPGVAGHQEQFRYNVNPNLKTQIGMGESAIAEADKAYDEGMQLEEANRLKQAQQEQTANTMTGTGLTLANKGNMATNIAAQKTFNAAVQKEMSKGLSKKLATEAVIKGGTAKPMAQGILGQGTASVAGSNMINVGSLIGTVGGGYLERAWSDDDPTTYTTKEGIAGAIKTGSSWAGYGNMILPGIGGLVGGLAGIGYSIFSGRKKAREARKEQQRLESDHKKKVGTIRGNLQQKIHASKQQVGSMMGNRLGGLRVNKYKAGGPKHIDPPVARQDSTYVAPTNEQMYHRWLEYQRQLEMQKLLEQEQLKQHQQLLMTPPVARQDTTYVPLPPIPPTKDNSVEKKEMGGFQQVMPEEMATMQQYQQPVGQVQQPFQMPMSDNIPYLKGGYKLRY